MLRRMLILTAAWACWLGMNRGPGHAGEPAVAPPARAADQGIPDEEGAAADLPPEVHDPAFEPYVNWDRLRDAIQEADALALTDAALQLLDAERALLRPHKGLAAEHLVRLAMRAAMEGRDADCLARLAKAVKASGKPDLIAQVEAAQKLASAPRRLDPGPGVRLDEVTPEAVVLYRTFLGQIRTARLVQDRKELEQLRQAVLQLDELHEKQQAHLVTMIQEGLAAIPAPAGAEADALAKLAAVSRGGFGPYPIPSGSRLLLLSGPGVLRVGEKAKCVVVMSARTAKPVVVALAASPPGCLDLPSQVTVPQGQISAKFEATARKAPANPHWPHRPGSGQVAVTGRAGATAAQWKVQVGRPAGPSR